MSGVLKPLICTAAPSLNRPAEPVNIDDISSISTVALRNVNPLPKKDDFTITFSMKSGGAGRTNTVVWSFKDEDERNSVYANIETTFCTIIDPA